LSCYFPLTSSFLHDHQIGISCSWLRVKSDQCSAYRSFDSTHLSFLPGILVGLQRKQKKSIDIRNNEEINEPILKNRAKLLGYILILLVATGCFFKVMLIFFINVLPLLNERYFPSELFPNEYDRSKNLQVTSRCQRFFSRSSQLTRS
jgi:hypothetical protein